MGRKSKKHNKASDGPALRIVPKGPPKRSIDTCHVTGEARDYHLHAMFVDEGDRVFRPKNTDPDRRDGWLVALPLILHSRQPDYTGAPKPSGPLLRYWQAGMPEHRKRSAQRLTFDEKYWWMPEWAERELFANFDHDAVYIVLSVVRDGQSWDDAMIGSNRAMSDVGALKVKMAQHCQALIRQTSIAA